MLETLFSKKCYLIMSLNVATLISIRRLIFQLIKIVSYAALRKLCKYYRGRCHREDRNYFA